LIGAEERGLWVLTVLCPLLKIRRTTFVDEFFELGFFFMGKFMGSIASFSTKSFDEEFHANQRTIFCFWTLG
jgi:hypothetical protein